MPIAASFAPTTAVDTPAVEARVVCLDGVRGLMTILVLVSHYFGEVPHGFRALMFGWFAVDMFFVLSGYLVGKLILEKQHHDNFFQVFYVRRVCRTLPIYFVCLAINVVLMGIFSAPWVDADHAFPIWSYFTFTQNFFMAGTSGIGPMAISGPTSTRISPETKRDFAARIRPDNPPREIPRTMTRERPACTTNWPVSIASRFKL